MTAQQIAVSVVEHGDQFVIGRRPKRAMLAGLWEFPGGKVELGESAEAAAIRECIEETGLDVDIVGEYPPHVEHYDHGTVHLRFFACRLLVPSQTPREPFQWVPRNSLSDYDFPAGNQGVLKILVAEGKAEVYIRATE